MTFPYIAAKLYLTTYRCVFGTNMKLAGVFVVFVVMTVITGEVEAGVHKAKVASRGKQLSFLPGCEGMTGFSASSTHTHTHSNAGIV